MSTPRLMGFKTEAAIAAILDSARSIALAEAIARRCGQDPDAARLRALQRFHDTARDEYRRLPEASRRVVWRRVLAAEVRKFHLLCELYGAWFP